jgi:hypothetical protein
MPLAVDPTTWPADFFADIIKPTISHLTSQTQRFTIRFFVVVVVVVPVYYHHP